MPTFIVIKLFFLFKGRSLKTHTRVLTLQMGIKIHFENSVRCIGVHGLSRAAQQLFVFAHACVL